MMTACKYGIGAFVGGYAMNWLVGKVGIVPFPADPAAAMAEALAIQAAGCVLGAYVVAKVL